MTILADGSWWDRVAEQARNPWEAVLACGQLLFFSRMLVQYIASERRKRVVLPVAFWWISMAGAAVTLLALANMPRPSPVLILAQVGGLLIYSRNLVLHNRQERAAA
jgi:lipid-A-disaccharide synthase-like uncharacterized protein